MTPALQSYGGEHSLLDELHEIRLNGGAPGHQLQDWHGMPSRVSA